MAPVSQFSQRTEVLSERLGCLLRDLPPKIGISDRMFYGYRSGSYPISSKAWRKLSAAERAAGLAGGGAPAATPPAAGEAPAEPPLDPGEISSEVAAQLTRLQEQMASLHSQMAAATAPLADLVSRMKSAGAWPPSESDLRLTPGELWAKYSPRR